jgi:L-2-hydroxyglutarate oxidase LhgO
MRADVVVVGGGLVGLASALQILERHPGARLTLVDKEPDVSAHQSGHNSGVMHAGLYYVPGSQKARLCREGGARLRAFCAEHDVPVRADGKLVVAVDESELDRLAELRRRGKENGIIGLHDLDPDQMREIEPHVRGVRALHVEESAVVDFRLVARRLADSVEASGGELVLGARLMRIAERPQGGLRLDTTRGAIETRALVACAGLQADRVAALSGVPVHERVVPFRGGYWVLRGAAQRLVRGLVYPVPDPAFPFLGVHFTPRHDGALWAGPNAVPALARERYSRAAFSVRDAAQAVIWPGFARLAARYAHTGALEIWRDVSKRAAVADMRRYLPDLRPEDVVRGPCGIRAQVMTRRGELVDDFLVREGPSSLHVINAPSPAATSCLALGAMIADRARAHFDL